MEDVRPRNLDEKSVAETVLEFQTPVSDAEGQVYAARAVASEMPGGNWQGWIEFTPLGAGRPLRSPRETTQPNRTDVEYWATGLTRVYLEGALARAKTPVRTARKAVATAPAFDEPAPRAVPLPSDQPSSVLDPFSVYRKGEELLRRQLLALSGWHLANIIVDHGLSSEDRTTLERLPEAALIEIIIDGVRRGSA
jgi:hypothetical protein